ncbi:MAG: cobalamin-binding protein [Halioglobus sp.]
MIRLIAIVLCFISASAQAEVTAVDLQGRTVVLSTPAKRVVALAPHIVENAYSAGAGDKLVGVVSYSNYPASAKRIKNVGNYQSWSLEAIVALEPDLILMWGSGNGLGALATLERLGIPIFISDPAKLEDIPYTIRAIGRLAGTEQVSEPEAVRLEGEIAGLRDTYASKMPLSIFYQVWDHPLQTLNGEHIISGVMNLCGGYNVFADAVSLAPKIGLESVLHRNPNAIVASGMGASRPDWLDDWKRYPSLYAVKNNGLFFVHPDHIQRPTARIAMGAKALCEQLDTLRQSTQQAAQN